MSTYLTVEKLRNNNMYKKQISKEIHNIIINIDESIKKAHLEGKTEINASLPILFDIPFRTNRDAQRDIYYGVFISLINRGFGVTLVEHSSESVMFEIKWVSESELADVKLKNAVLAKNTRKKT